MDSSRHQAIIMKVVEAAMTTAPSMRPDEAVRYRSIEEEGDGLRSYVAICMAMLVGYRPLCLIDEPESCLHPPQEYALGKFIGAHATEHGHTTVVSTHSSQILRGILERASAVTVVRLSHHGDQFLAHGVPPDQLNDAVKKPSVRSDQVLDGIFSDGVIVVESDTDRIVYQAAYEATRSDDHFDASFITVSGTGGIAATVKFFCTLSMPTAVIADLDVLSQPVTSLKATLESLGCDSGTLKEVGMRCDKLRSAVMALPPSMTTSNASEQFKSLAVPVSWDGGADDGFVRSLRKLSNDIDRNRKLKLGLTAFSGHSEIVQDAQWIIEKCRAYGYFLVEVGELEKWSLPEGENVSDHRKADLANEAVSRIRQTPEEARGVIQFVAGVGHHLRVRRKAAFSAGVPNQVA
jgi:energy-coupling factor transporter ATP-binding protein EcfA2